MRLSGKVSLYQILSTKIKKTKKKTTRFEKSLFQYPEGPQSYILEANCICSNLFNHKC